MTTPITFNVKDDQIDLLSKLVDGYRDKDAFLSDAIRVMAAKKREDRLLALRMKAAQELGERAFATDEIVAMTRGLGATDDTAGDAAQTPDQPHTRGE